MLPRQLIAHYFHNVQPYNLRSGHAARSFTAFANADTLKLPGLRKTANAEYSSRRLGISKAEMYNLRSALLLEAVKGFRPDVVLVDKHPFGAGGELEPALEAAKSHGARLVLGLRDILDDPPNLYMANCDLSGNWQFK